MLGFLVVVLVVAGAGVLFALYRSVRPGQRWRSTTPTRPRAHPAGSAAPLPIPTPRPAPAGDDGTARIAVRPSERPRPEGRVAFAEPGMRGRLLHYGGNGPGFELDASYAVIDIETTGFSPGNGDRIVEIAIARVDPYGRIEDEYATLVDPGRDVGPVFVHGISNVDVRDAPRFEEIAGEILARMEGAVVVAHNAVFVERFLGAEFARAGIALSPSPALCSLWLARQTMGTPNHRLRTLARAAGLQTVDAHAALGDVRTVAALLPAMLLGLGEEPRFTCGFRPMPVLPRGVRPRPRAQELRKGTGGWMASLLSRLPMSAAEVTDVDAQRYLDALAGALEDGRVLGGEAATLARLAGSAGLGGAQVAELHRRFLESLRSLALADDILTTAEIRQLKTAAGLVGMPTFFDDLRATSPQDLLGNRFVPAPRDAIAG